MLIKREIKSEISVYSSHTSYDISLLSNSEITLYSLPPQTIQHIYSRRQNDLEISPMYILDSETNDVLRVGDG